MTDNLEIENFTVSSKGHCLFCLAKPGSGFEWEGCSPASLLALSRYVNLDPVQVLNGPGPSHIKIPRLFANVNNVGLQGTLCRDCKSLNEVFTGLYSQLVKIESELESSLRLIREKLIKPERTGQKQFFAINRVENITLNVNQEEENWEGEDELDDGWGNGPNAPANFVNSANTNGNLPHGASTEESWEDDSEIIWETGATTAQKDEIRIAVALRKTVDQKCFQKLNPMFPPVIQPSTNHSDQHVHLHTETKDSVCQTALTTFVPGDRTLTTNKLLQTALEGSQIFLGVNEANFACPDCDKQFTSPYSMLNHFKCVHVRPIIGRILTCISCRKCKLEFSSHEKFTTHFTNFHGVFPPTSILNADTMQNTCSICQQTIIESDFENHFRAHFKLRDNCVECGQKNKNKLFNFRHHLIRHMEKFVCYICNEILDSKSGLKNHKTRMPDCDGIVCSCRKCRKEFQSFAGFKAHFKIEHTAPSSSVGSTSRRKNKKRCR